MRTILFALAFMLAAQGPSNPFPNHEEPPAGWFCSPGARDAAHKCNCHRVDDDPTCEGTPHEDSICKVYCHADHCHCPVACEKPTQ